MKSTDNQSNTSKKNSKVWGFGTLPLNGVDIDVLVLEDGTPLIGTRKILKVLGRGQKGDYVNQSRPPFLASNNLQPFIKVTTTSKTRYWKSMGTKRTTICSTL